MGFCVQTKNTASETLVLFSVKHKMEPAGLIKLSGKLLVDKQCKKKKKKIKGRKLLSWAGWEVPGVTRTQVGCLPLAWGAPQTDSGKLLVSPRAKILTTESKPEPRQWHAGQSSTFSYPKKHAALWGATICKLLLNCQIIACIGWGDFSSSFSPLNFYSIFT